MEHRERRSSSESGVPADGESAARTKAAGAPERKRAKKHRKVRLDAPFQERGSAGSTMKTWVEAVQMREEPADLARATVASGAPDECGWPGSNRDEKKSWAVRADPEDRAPETTAELLRAINSGSKWRPELGGKSAPTKKGGEDEPARMVTTAAEDAAAVDAKWRKRYGGRYSRGRNGRLYTNRRNGRLNKCHNPHCPKPWGHNFKSRNGETVCPFVEKGIATINRAAHGISGSSISRGDAPEPGDAWGGIAMATTSREGEAPRPAQAMVKKFEKKLGGDLGWRRKDDANPTAPEGTRSPPRTVAKSKTTGERVLAHSTNTTKGSKCAIRRLGEGLAVVMIDGREYYAVEKDAGGERQYALASATGATSRAGISKTWLLLDSQSTIDVIVNERLCEPGTIHEADNKMRIFSDGGFSETRRTGYMKGIGWVWIQNDGIANIFLLKNMQKRFRVPRPHPDKDHAFCV